MTEDPQEPEYAEMLRVFKEYLNEASSARMFAARVQQLREAFEFELSTATFYQELMNRGYHGKETK